MPQLTSAATSHGEVAWLRRWPYHAKVMNTLEAISRPMVCTDTGNWVNQDMVFPSGHHNHDSASITRLSVTSARPVDTPTLAVTRSWATS